MQGIRNPAVGPNTTHVSFIVPSSASTKQIHTQICNTMIRSDSSNLRNVQRSVYDRGIIREMSNQLENKKIKSNVLLAHAISAEKAENEKENNNIVKQYKDAGIDFAVDKTTVDEIKIPQTDNQLLLSLTQKYNLPVDKIDDRLAIKNTPSSVSTPLAIKN